MSLPTPNLDDRSFEEIVNEAIKLIPGKCNRWTDFNPSDPGITLIELMAWMTEMIIYRLNRVPEKSYIEFLSLMGISLKPPQPSMGWVVFSVVSGAQEKDLPYIRKGTRIRTGDTTIEPIVFETVSSLNLTTSRIIKACSKFRERYNDHPALIEEGTREIPIFFGEKYVPHILYLGDSRLGAIGKEIHLKLFVTLSAESVSNPNIEWEYWDGKEWGVVVPLKDDTFELRKSGEIFFESLPVMEEKEIDENNSFWLRARLTAIEEERLPRFASLKRTFELKPRYDVVPDKGYLSTEKIPIDFYRNFYPFGKEPRENDELYLGSRIFSRKEARVSIKVILSESYDPLGIESLKELEVCWEYYSETGSWKLLGITAPTNLIESKHGFTDETEAFTHSGTISFICPEDVALFTKDGEENFWIRSRITKGNYGVKKISPPLIKTLLIGFEEKSQNFEHYISYNYFSYKDLTPIVKETKPIEAFEIQPEEDPAFYLAFDSLLSNKLHRIYFCITEQKMCESRVLWEFLSKEGWKELRLFKDGTSAFSQKGAIEFIPSPDWSKEAMFGQEGYWLRARWEAGNYTVSPKLVGMHLNPVEVIQAISIHNEVLGSSNGEAYQTHTFSNSPILPNPKILVKEFKNPSAEQIKSIKEELKDDVIEDVDPDGKVTALWIRWHEVENFFKSCSESRHYTLDCYKAAVTFGDGKKGKIPSIGGDNIKSDLYYIGGGNRGNVGKNTITLLDESYPSIESVRNPDSADGGSDAETIEEAKLRGPWILKHRYRAVTIEDFEKLAFEASGEVAKAKCYIEDSEIMLIIVPKGDSEKLRPGNMLLQTIKKYLNDRRLITTRLSIAGPDYVDISIEAEVSVMPQKVEIIPEIKNKMKLELRNFFHPLKGGSAKNGWPMGRPVYISEIYNVLENVEEVDFVRRLKLNKNPWLKKVEIGNINYPFLKEVNFNLS